MGSEGRRVWWTVLAAWLLPLSVGCSEKVSALGFPGDQPAVGSLIAAKGLLTVRALRLLSVKDCVEENDGSPPLSSPFPSPMDLGSSESPRAFGKLSKS